MNAGEQTVYNRHPYDPSGRVIARREVTIGGVIFAAGDEMPSLVELGLTEYEGRRLYRTMAIDTLPLSVDTRLVERAGKKPKK